MKKLLLIALVANLAGCAVLSPINNYESSTISPTDMAKIAEDGSEIMAAHYPPGKTQLSVAPNGVFGGMLIKSLRQKGFAVAEKQGQGTATASTSLNYLLDELDPATYRLGLITPMWRTDVAYQRNHDGILRKNQTQRVENNE